MTKAELRSAAVALVQASLALSEISDTPRLDAELLMAHGLGMDRSGLLLRKADLTEPPDYATMIMRRMQHEPVAYIIGQQDFWDLTLDVTPDVLIPRGDSETLIEAAQNHFVDTPAPRSVTDLGTGSGALLLAALSVFANATGVAIDASAAALKVANGNARNLNFAERAQFLHLSWRQPDWCTALLKANGGAPFDLLLCNPPYVESDAALSSSVRDHEPASALFAGADGLDDYRLLIPQVSALLSPNGIAIFEIGRGQASAVTVLAEQHGFTVTARCDLAGILRALSLTRSGAQKRDC